MSSKYLLPEDERWSLVHQLQESAGRHQHRKVLLEGVRAILGSCDAGLRPEFIVWSDVSALNAFHDGIDELPINCEQLQLSPKQMRKMSQQKTPPGLMAVFALPDLGDFDPAFGGIIADRIQDPGNLGTILRSALAFGFQQVLLLGGADPLSHKVLQSSMGAVSSLYIKRYDDSELKVVEEARLGAPLAALVMEGGVAPEDLSDTPRWLMIGNEANGLSIDLIERANERISLSMSGPVESLNAAVALSICCYTLRRA